MIYFFATSPSCGTLGDIITKPMESMRKIVKLLLGIFSLLLLTACPASHFHNYSYVGNNEKEILIGNELNYSNFSNIQNAKCGFLYQFIDNKERLLIVKIDSLTEKIKSVESKKLGVLQKVEKIELDKANINNSEVYRKIIESKNESKILKNLKNDTITIELENGLKYYYEKK